MAEDESPTAVAPLPRPTKSSHCQPTDIGNAQRLAISHGDVLRFVPEWKSWLVWDGQRWRRDVEDVAITAAAKDCIRRMANDASDLPDAKVQEYLKWAAKSQSAPRVAAAIKLARSEEGIPAEVASLDSHPWLLNTSNGTIDLKTGELRPHDSADLLTKITSVECAKPGTPTPLWDAFLNRIFADDSELIGFVRRLLGSAIVGNQSEHILPIFHGDGGNGKGVLIRLLGSVLGEYAGTAVEGLFLVRKHSGHPAELADLHGKRFVTLQENDQNHRLDEAKVKSLTGGDSIKARGLYENFFEFRPTHTLVLATNHKPKVVGTDGGIWRRLRLIPFDVTIPTEDVIPNYEEQLAAEGPGILRWLVDGCLEWQEIGLREPDAVMSATEAYRHESDSVGRFLEEWAVPDPNAVTIGKRAFGTFEQWCRSENVRELSTTEFYRRVVSAAGWNLEVTKRNVGKVILGMQLRDSDDSEAT